MSSTKYGRFAAAFAVACLASSLPAAAGCVGKNGESRSGVRDHHSISKHSTDNKPFVRVTPGPVTIQVDVKGSYGTCSHGYERLSFEVLTKKSRAYVDCLNPSVQGPAGFLSCYFKARKQQSYAVEVTNDGPCRLKYDLICWNGKQTP